MPSVSIKDIAREAGVSYSTVSRALNDNPLISQEVRRRIQGLARSMGYTPNALALGLISHKTHSIGLVITTFSDPFFADIAQGVEEVARQNNISVYLATSNNEAAIEVQIIEIFNRRRVDGVIVAASRISSAYATRLEQVRIPVVIINHQSMGEYQYLYSVAADDYVGGWMAMQHLLELGHRRIGYMGAGNRPGSNARRMQSYLDALQRSGITPQADWICTSQRSNAGDLLSDFRMGQEMLEDLLKAGLTAIFCYCDTLAAGVLSACRQRGVAVPEELSVIGYDDNDLCQVLDPPLTTIHQPKRELGQAAMEMLLNSIRGLPVNDSVLQPSLVVRNSTAPPR